MKSFVNIQQPHIPSYNLEVVSNAYNKLNEGHIQAIQAQSELQSAIAQLDLNETEEDFRQSLVSEINQTVQENTRYNNAYFALPDIIAKAGNINSNPELIGRLRAQQAYKANIAAIDARTDVNDAAKEMAKALSPYYYRDKQTGELINNGVWKPGYSPVKSYDANQILQLIGQYVSPDKGEFSGPISFLNADGSISDHWDPAGGLGVLNQQTGEWTRLSEEKIKYGWNAAIAANPGIIASLKQDYEVANWNLDTKGEDIYNIIGKDGSRITFNDFVNRIIDPYAKAKSYYNTSSTIEYKDATIQAYNSLLQAKAKTAAQQKQLDELGQISIDTPGHTYYKENTDLVDTNRRIVSENNSFKSYVSDYLQNSGLAVDINNLDINNREQTLTTLRNGKVSETDINTIMKEYDRIADLTYSDRKHLDTIYNSMTPRAQAARKLSDDMKVGNIIDSDYFTDNNSYNRWVKISGKIIDEAFKYGNNYFKAFDKKEYNDLIEALGGKDVMQSLGYKFIENKGKYYIGLDKENSNQFYQFSDAIQTIRKSRNFSTNFVNTLFSNGGTEDSYYVDENGKMNILYTSNPRFAPGGDITSIYRNAANFMNRLDRIAKRIQPDELSEYMVKSYSSPGGTIEENQYRNILAGINDPELITLYKNRLDAIDENLSIELSNGDWINSNIRIISENKKDGYLTFKIPTTKEIIELKEAVQHSDAINKSTKSIERDEDGNLYTVINIPVGSGDKKHSVRVSLESINTPASIEYRNSPDIIAGNQLVKANRNNKGEQIAFYTDDLGNKQYIMLYPVGNSDKSFYIGYNDEIDTSKVVDYKTAVALKMIYNGLSTLNPNNYKSIEDFKNSYNLYTGLFNNFYNTNNGIITLPNYASTNLQPVIDEILGR